MLRMTLFVVLGLGGSAALAASYGAAVPAGEAQTISSAVQAMPAQGEAALYRGRVVEVCQKKGCWAMLEDQGTVARLMMRDHAFSIPKDYTGEARVYGHLQRIELSEAAAKHLAEDAGRSEGVARHEYRIDTLGIELQDQGVGGGD